MVVKSSLSIHLEGFRREWCAAARKQEADNGHWRYLRAPNKRPITPISVDPNGMRKTRRKQLVEIKGRKTRQKQLVEIKGRKIRRKQLVEIEGRKTRRIITDYNQGLFSANYGLIFLNSCVNFSVLRLFSYIIA